MTLTYISQSNDLAFNLISDSAPIFKFSSVFCIFHGIHGILERTCQKMSWNSVIQASFFYCIYRKYNIFPRFFFMKFLQTSTAFSSICCRTIEFSTNFSRFPTLDSADGGIVFRQKSDCKITFVFGHGKW